MTTARGLAAVLVGFASYTDPSPDHWGSIFLAEILVAVWIGAITFTGSVVAFGKLRGSIRSKPLLLPGRHLLNLAMVGGSIAAAVPFMGAEGATAVTELIVVAADLPAGRGKPQPDIFFDRCRPEQVPRVRGRRDCAP